MAVLIDLAPVIFRSVVTALTSKHCSVNCRSLRRIMSKSKKDPWRGRSRKSKWTRPGKGKMKGAASVRIAAPVPPVAVADELPPRRAKVIAASNIANDLSSDEDDKLMDDDDDDASINPDAVMEVNASIEADDTTDGNSNSSPSIEDIVANAVMENNASIEADCSTKYDNSNAASSIEDIVASAVSDNNSSSELVVASAGDPSSTMRPRGTTYVATTSTVVLASITTTVTTTITTEEDTSFEVYLPMEDDTASNYDNETVEEMFEDDESVADDVAIHEDYEAVEEASSTPLPKPKNPRDMLTNVDIRRMISHLYLNMNAPPPEKWNNQGGTIPKLMNILGLAKTQRNKVYRVVLRTYQALQNGEMYDLERNPRENNPTAIKDGSHEQQMVADCLEKGLSYAVTTDLINHYLFQNGEETIRRSAVVSCSKRMKAQVTKIVKRPQGSDDEASRWARCRSRISAQSLIRQGKFVDVTPLLDEEDGPNPDFFNPEKLPPYEQHGVGWWDVSTISATVPDIPHLIVVSSQETHSHADVWPFICSNPPLEMHKGCYIGHCGEGQKVQKNSFETKMAKSSRRMASTAASRRKFSRSNMRKKLDFALGLQ